MLAAEEQLRFTVNGEEVRPQAVGPVPIVKGRRRTSAQPCPHPTEVQGHGVLFQGLR